MTEFKMDKNGVNLLLQGDRKSIGHFVDAYGSFIYNVCYKVLLHKGEAEEAAQDAIMKSIKALGSYSLHSSFKAWCYTIAFRTAIDYKRKIKYTTDITSMPDPISDRMTDADILNNEEKSSIIGLLSHLDDESRVLMSLFYLEEKNIKELMVITDLTESNIKIKLFRARKVLAEYAPKYFEKVN